MITRMGHKGIQKKDCFEWEIKKASCKSGDLSCSENEI